MKNALLVLSLILGTVSASFAHDYPNPIAPKDAKAWVDEGKAVLIDIREQSEVTQGMAEPAVWYPKSSIDANLANFIGYLGQFNGKEIVLYCRSGRRVSVVVQLLAQKGIKAWNMGGYQDWMDAGLPSRTPSSDEL